MKIASDMRIPVLFGAQHAAAGHAYLDAYLDADLDAYLIEGDAGLDISGYAERFALPAAKFGHLQGCNCCTPRGPAADALSRMFRSRATGAVPFFKRVIVLASPAGEAAVRDAITGDVVTAARFRLPD